MVTGFYGDDLPNWKYKHIANTSINAELLNRENDALVTHKLWFDYVDMHPTQRTYYFAHCYQQGIKEIYRKNRDVDKAETLIVFKREDIFQLKKQQVTSIWKARQTIDMLGIPYHYYINSVIQYAVDNLWTFYPKLNQLYSLELLQAGKNQWERELSARIILPEDPQYLIENFTKTFHQLRFLNWLCHKILEREHPANALYSYMYLHPFLNEEIATHYFNNETISLAKSYATI